MSNVCHWQTGSSTAKVCRWKIDAAAGIGDYAPMAKNERKTSIGPQPAKVVQKRPLHLGEWLARLDRTQSEVAERVGIGKSYMSSLVSNAKNATPLTLLAISEELGITVNDLFKEPPPKSAMEKINRFRPDQIAALGDLISEFKSKR